jgi:hypothetical protein
MMIPFAERFPGIAENELLTLRIEGRADLPDGEYFFEELYCDEKNCDCRRVIINVETLDPVEEVLATINYGWESLDYYARWTSGPKPDPEIQGPSLDPLNKQTPHSEPLLALFRDAIRNPAYVERLKRHYRLFIIRFAHLPGNLPHDLTGDLITEQFCKILASICGGDIGPIQGLIEDPFVEEYVRSAGLRALNVLVQVGALRREEVVAYHRRLFSGSLERAASYVWDSLVCCATDLHPGEVLGDIRHAYREGLVETFSISFEEVEEEAQRSVEAIMAELGKHDGGLIEDTVAEMEWWACFHSEPDEEWDDDEDRDDEEDSDSLPPEPYVHEDWDPLPPETYIRPDRKIGRNETCPCGSGKKYKKCCGG